MVTSQALPRANPHTTFPSTSDSNPCDFLHPVIGFDKACGWSLRRNSSRQNWIRGSGREAAQLVPAPQTNCSSGQESRHRQGRGGMLHVFWSVRRRGLQQTCMAFLQPRRGVTRPTGQGVPKVDKPPRSESEPGSTRLVYIQGTLWTRGSSHSCLDTTLLPQEYLYSHDVQQRHDSRGNRECPISRCCSGATCRCSWGPEHPCS